MNGLSVLILAAGQSSRMGQSKQLLRLGTETILENCIKKALLTKANNVAVVLGSEAERHELLIQKFPIDIIVNHQWQSGIGSSIKVGLQQLVQNKKPIATVVMVCDQPYVSVEHINKLIDVLNTSGQDVVASSYADTIGTPVIFSRTVFNTVLEINDSEGAKKIISKLNHVTIELANGEVDLDTPEDYANFLQKEKEGL